MLAPKDQRNPCPSRLTAGTEVLSTKAPRIEIMSAQ